MKPSLSRSPENKNRPPKLPDPDELERRHGDRAKKPSETDTGNARKVDRESIRGFDEENE